MLGPFHCRSHHRFERRGCIVAAEFHDASSQARQTTRCRMQRCVERLARTPGRTNRLRSVQGRSQFSREILGFFFRKPLLDLLALVRVRHPKEQVSEPRGTLTVREDIHCCFLAVSACSARREQLAVKPRVGSRRFHGIDEFDHRLLFVVARGALEWAKIESRWTGGDPCQPWRRLTCWTLRRMAKHDACLCQAGACRTLSHR